MFWVWCSLCLRFSGAERILRRLTFRIGPIDPRKVKTESELEVLGIPINRQLLLVEGENGSRIRAPRIVAKRAVVLHAVAAVGRGEDRTAIEGFLKAEGLWTDVTPNERLLFQKEEPSRQSLIEASWRAECVWTLLWALGKVENWGCRRTNTTGNMFGRSCPEGEEVAAFIASAALRPSRK